jgi:CheY-like chemotaxis protein
MEPQTPDRKPQAGDVVHAPATPDSGSFSDLRLAPPDAGGQPASSRKPAPRARPLILVVDDEPDVVFVTKTRLRLNGYDVAETADGETALKRIQQLRPDLVLLDLRMPNLDGYAVCRKIKADQDLRSTLILIHSASSLLGLTPEKRCLEIGADGYIRKPYDVGRLLEEISRLLAQRKMAGAAGS